MTADALWLSAEQEADNTQTRNPALWARCFAQAQGDAAKTKALYMAERVRQQGGQVPGASKWPGRLGLAALLLVSLFAIAAWLLPDDGSAQQRDVISLCWKDHQNPSLDAGTKAFVANTCQSLETQYQKQYGRAP